MLRGEGKPPLRAGGPGISILDGDPEITDRRLLRFPVSVRFDVGHMQQLRDDGQDLSASKRGAFARVTVSQRLQLWTNGLTLFGCE